MMKLNSSLLVSILIVAIAVAIGLGVKLVVPDVQDDSCVEEIAEVVIKSQTGIDIDLTPQSSEKG